METVKTDEAAATTPAPAASLPSVPTEEVPPMAAGSVIPTLGVYHKTGDLVVRDNYPSDMEIKSTHGLEDNMTNRFFLFEIDDFHDDIEFNLATLSAGLKLLRLLDGVLVSASKTLDPVTHRAVFYEMGIKHYDVVHSHLKSEHAASLYAVRLLMGREHIFGSRFTERLNSYFASPNLTRLIEQLNELNLSWLSPVQPVHRLFSLMLRRDLSVAPLPKDLDPEFVFIRGPPNLESLELFRARVPAINQAICGAMFSHIANHPVITEAPRGVVQEITRMLAVNINRFDTMTDYVASITTGSARRFWDVLLMCKSCSYYSEMYVPIGLDEFTIAALIGCLFMKIMVPREALALETVHDIDNYIFFHLTQHARIPGLRDVPASITEIKSQPVDAAGRNWLQNQMIRWRNTLRLVPASAATRNAYVRFLLTNMDNGDGWASAGIIAPHQLDAAFEQWRHSRELWSDVPMPQNRVTKLPQWGRFQVFVSQLRIDNVPRLNGVENQFRRLINWIASRLDERMSSFFYALMHTVYNLCMSTLSRARVDLHAVPTYPYNIDGVVVEREIMRERFMCELNGPFSCAMLVNFDKIDYQLVGPEWLENGWETARFFHELACVYDRIQAVYTDVRYSKSDKLAAIVALVEPSPFVQILQEKIGSSTALYDFMSGTVVNPVITAATSSVHMRKLLACIAYVYANPPSFGYTPSFIYNGAGTSLVYNPRPGFRRGFVRNIDHAFVMTFREFREACLSHAGLYNAINGRVVRMGFPIKTEIVETEAMIVPEQPFEIDKAGFVVRLKKLKIFFEFTDKFRVTFDNDYVNLQGVFWWAPPAGHEPVILPLNSALAEYRRRLVARKKGLAVFDHQQIKTLRNY